MLLMHVQWAYAEHCIVKAISMRVRPLVYAKCSSQDFKLAVTHQQVRVFGREF